MKTLVVVMTVTDGGGCDKSARCDGGSRRPSLALVPKSVQYNPIQRTTGRQTCPLIEVFPHGGVVFPCPDWPSWPKQPSLWPRFVSSSWGKSDF